LLNHTKKALRFHLRSIEDGEKPRQDFQGSHFFRQKHQIPDDPRQTKCHQKGKCYQQIVGDRTVFSCRLDLISIFVAC